MSSVESVRSMRYARGMDIPLNHLSPAARHVLSISDSAYRELVPRVEGPLEARDVLESLKPVELLTSPARDLLAAAAAISGLWLWHDFLDESHTISQSIHTPTGSYWHAIMHRREGDFSNAKYWYRQCDNHAAIKPIAAQLRQSVDVEPADKRLLKITMNGFDPCALVDLIESVHRSNVDPLHRVAVAIQQVEWRVLMAITIHEALGQ
jgi:hypothetical protein